MEAFEAEVLEVVKLQPEKNPDGSLWRIQLGGKNWTKNQILDEWSRNSTLRGNLVKKIMGLKLHRMSRGPPE